MPNQMERFTQRARRVLSLAQEEAERFRHNYIGTEHLLLGLMREEGGVASRVLADLGLEVRRVAELVERLTRASTHTSTMPQLFLSPGTKKVLELAVDEARRMGHHYIGTEHILLGLIRHPEGVAIDVLKRLGVSPEEVRRQTRRVLQESPVQNPLTAQQSPASRAPAGAAGPSVPPTFYSVPPTTERMRILRLIEDGKITVDEATRLLSALEAPASLLYPALAPMIAYIFKWSGAEKRRLRVKISDKASGELKVELIASSEQIESAITNIIEAVFKAATGKIGEFEDETTRVELFIEDSEPPREEA